MKHCTGTKCQQGRKPCHCGTPDTPHVPLLVPVALVLWLVFVAVALVSSF